MKSQANLRVVIPSPEDELSRLFAQENVLLDELRDVRARQAEARERYRITHGLMMNPTFDRLRQVVGKA